ncbi:hypothetical protein D3C76_857400 [compost metagenome]
MPLRGELFEARQLQALAGQAFPGLAGTVQLFGSSQLRVMQTAQLQEPGMLQLKLLELRLLMSKLLLRGVEALIELGTGLRRQWRDAAGLVLQLFVGLTGFLGLVEGPTAQAGVERGVGEFFQQFAAVVVIGLEEGAELALRQQHGPGELFEIQAQCGFELGLVFTFLAGQQLILIEVAQALAAGLQFATGLFPGAIGFPACAITAAVDADKIHFGITFASAAAQQGARVAGADFAIGVRHLGVAPGVVQPRHGTEQGQAQRVEQGALAGAGGAGDGEQSGTGQGFGGEVDFKRPGQ